jgi:hypothetical protein
MTSGRPETSTGFFLERVVLGRDISTSLAVAGEGGRESYLSVDRGQTRP